MQKEFGKNQTLLGIDIGSVSISAVQMNYNAEILSSRYIFHNGNITNALFEIEKGFDLESVAYIGSTASESILAESINYIDPQVSLINAARYLNYNKGSILHVGAEYFKIINFNKQGEYQFTNTNSSCAAGTGSFLDQQAQRLNLANIEELSEKALKNTGTVPDIASRCAVFAKTDLIHVQQKGYSIEAICDSLCKGLAKNIIDTLFNKELPGFPILFTGGVSKNIAVIKHIEQMLNTKLIVLPDSHLFSAMGICYTLLDNSNSNFKKANINSFVEILNIDKTKKEYFHDPLNLKLSNYPEFESKKSYSFTTKITKHKSPVQVDIYSRILKKKSKKCYLGVDIGSTSTKAILTGTNEKPLAGFYTYTSGNPLNAINAIFETIQDFADTSNTLISVCGVGTTGSGRNFIGKIINADLIIDEITTHAKAAYELNPKTDTIIEIGGQDAKFTLMKDGIVTFSQMNTVCAAGTGSFIEEQAKKLNCSLKDYSEKAAGVQAPLASDRCTVFMERDINQHLNNGFSVNEVLATTIHSVMENYLKKVATEAAIGGYVCFQGATAKNRSLVAAFEQKLQKQIYVSEYCHLTGALGIAIMLHEEKCKTSSFRGIDIFKEKIKLSNETCTLCNNACVISLAEVKGEKVAYGFLCGRDYDTKKYVHKKVSGFDLIKQRQKMFETKPVTELAAEPTFGVPAFLHLFEEMSLWKRFFNKLSINAITSESYTESVKKGKQYAGAEFCAPIDSIYGHSVYLSDKVDYIFIPVFLETRNKTKNSDRNYCYYTQFSGSLVYTLKYNGIADKCLTPFLNFNKSSSTIAKELLVCLKPIIKSRSLKHDHVLKAYEEAVNFYKEKRNRLPALYAKHKSTDEISVVLFGRPYIVLSKSLNKGIPDIFSGMGIKTFYQDMLPVNSEFEEEIAFMLKKVPWHFAAEILKAVQQLTKLKNHYPVFITAFKCAPDSFIIEYFKKIMNKANKPYLILQIDEHDSNVGYETRIEAAIRSFRNHAAIVTSTKLTETKDVFPKVETKLNGKTLLFPDWDPIVSPLIIANLKRSGVDARLMESNDLIIKKSMAHNTGQCLPLNIITQEFIEYVEKNNLNPENTLLWMMDTNLSCNLKLYPYFMKTHLNNYGNGFEKAQVYCGDLTHIELSFKTTYHAYFAYMLGGLIRKVGCKIRPYEINKGKTDAATEASISILEKAFIGDDNLDEAIGKCMKLFDKIELNKETRKKVAIFGDFYVRDNDIMNQNLIKAIENSGGEVVTTPYNDYGKITFENFIRRATSRGEYVESGIFRILLSVMKLFDEKYFNKHFRKYLGPKPVIKPLQLEKNLEKFRINIHHSGESYDNILKIFYLIENYPDISLLIQTNPAFCCPSLVTEAMTAEIKRITGIPVITITYDGTSEYKNDVIVPYLQCN